MECPKCASYELVPVYHPRAAAREPAPDIRMCPHCGGLWMASTTAIRLIGSDTLLQPIAVDDPEAARARDAKTGMCPNHHGLLIRITIFDDEPYSLERCAQCGGMWFDGGEWERLRTNPQDHRVLDWDLSETLAVAALKDVVERDALVARYGEALVGQLETLADALRSSEDSAKALAYLRLRLAE